MSATGGTRRAHRAGAAPRPFCFDKITGAGVFTRPRFTCLERLPRDYSSMQVCSL
jgi:hypothetical protein